MTSPPDTTTPGAALAATPAAPLTDAWHATEPEGVLAAQATAADGLDDAEAMARRARHGPNTIPRATRDGPLLLLWRQINNPLIYVLIGSGLLAVVMGKPIDGAVVLGVVVLNAIIGFLQEYRAGKAIEALIDMVPETATVLRSGQRLAVGAAELVPGDVVLLQSGDKVPADMRLIAMRGLQVDEAPLTGESVPVAKELDVLPPETPLADRRNMVYGGTLVTSGTGTAVVVETGGRTELGRISAMLREATEIVTPLTRQLATVGKWITVAILVVAVLLFAVGMLRGYPVVTASLAAITLAVGAIPEGLPAIITIALAIGVQRMARRRAVIRRLPAVETLGSTTVICTDKTGTLTRNEMTVQELWSPGGPARLSGVGYEPVGAIVRDGQELTPPLPADARRLLRAGLLCSDATIRREDGIWRTEGDPTEVALVVAAHKGGLEQEPERADYPRVDAIPFESERQFMATLHEQPTGTQVIALKGAPEVVLARCDRQVGVAKAAETAPLDRAAVLAEVERLAAQGMRVLAFAERVPEHRLSELHDDDVRGGFWFMGLQGMIDPPRTEAMTAIRACHAAGITVKMITGDHQTTARAIGAELGLLGPDRDGPVLTGAALGALSDDELRAELGRTNVFARVAPEHKLRIVRALQADGQVVAMTGDGVNDAPALKQADIGVAMGITGTAVSKESADVVLADDNFASIAAAVEEGRRVYDNLVKALAFVLPTNIGLALILTWAVAFFPIVNGEPLLPMLPTQILWINLVAAVALALPLAFEAMESDVMRRPPRRPEAPLFGAFLAIRTVIVAVLMAAGAIGLFLVQFGADMARGIPLDVALREAQTMAVTTVILFQVLYLLNCRSLRDSILGIGLWTNPTVYLGIGVVLALQVAFVYVPFMNFLFGTAPLGLESWLEATAAALILLPAIGLEKWWWQWRAARERGSPHGR